MTVRERDGGGGRERGLPDVPHVRTVSRYVQGNPHDFTCWKSGSPGA